MMNEVVEKLSHYLLKLTEENRDMPFDEIEKAIGLHLPDQAGEDSWWKRFLILSNLDIEFRTFSCYHSILRVNINTQLPNYQRLASSKEVFFERWNLSNNEDNFPILLTRLLNECSGFFSSISTDTEYLNLFCSMHGKSFPRLTDDRVRMISKLVAESKNVDELAYILQTLFMLFSLLEKFSGMRDLKMHILKVLEITSNPPFFLVTDIVNGEINIYKSGAELLDENLVNYCLHWLAKYPEVRKLFSKALKNYSNDNLTDEDARSIYDDLRASLEKLIKVILGNSRTLENNKKAIEQWLVGKETHPNVVAMFKFIIHQFIEFMNDAKHVNKYSANDLEFMVYQTAIMMRMLLEKERS